MMQNSIVKKATQAFFSKLKWNQSVLKNLGTPLASLSIQNTAGLNQMSKFFFASKDGDEGHSHSSSKYDKITSYENLISRISTSENLGEVLKHFEQNEQLYKNEHIVLSLRMLARLVRNSNPKDLEGLLKDERYINLIKKADEAIPTLNEYEILDFLFWLRKFRVAKLQIKIPEDRLDKFYQRTEEFLKSKSFNFRNLVNLFYDYSFIGRNCDEIVSEILKELKTDSKLMTPFTVIQILQSCSQRNVSPSTREYLLVDFVQRNFSTIAEEFDTDQKCAIFRYFSSLELSFHPPRYRVPSLLYNMKNELKEKLDQLSESGVIHILNAYETLPKEFPNDLLEEIKEMVIITVQHNGANIKSFFLLDFIEVVLRLRKKRKIPDNKLTILLDEVAKRIPTDEHLGRYKSLDRIIQLLDQGVKSPNLVKAFAELIKANPKKVLPPSVYEYVAKHKADVDAVSIFQEVLPNEEALNQFANNYKVRFYLILKHLETDKFVELEKKLEESVNSLVESDTTKMIYFISSSLIFNSTRRELLLKAITRHKLNWKTGNDQNFFKAVLQSIELKQQRLAWFEFLKEKQAEFDVNLCNRFLDAFFNVEEPGQDHYLFLMNFMTVNINVFPLKKLLYNLKDNRDFYYLMDRNEFLMRRIFTQLISLSRKNPKDIRLHYIYPMALRFEALNNRSNIFLNYLKTSYNLAQLNEQTKISGPFEVIYMQTLLNYGALTFEQAKEIHLKYKDNSTVQDPHLASKFLNYALLRDKKGTLEEESYSAFLNEKMQYLNKQLSSASARQVLTAIATLLTFPPKFFKTEKDLASRSLKDYLSHGNSQLYTNLVTSLVPTYVKENHDLYYPFVKELINSYANFSKRLPFSDILRILKAFVNLNTKNPNLYNQILTDVGRNFHMIKAEDRIEVLFAFAKIGIKQDDLYIKIIKKIVESPYLYRSYLENILNSLFTVGFDSTTEGANENILEFVEKSTIEKYGGESLAFLKLAPLLSLKNEREIVEKYVNILLKCENKNYVVRSKSGIVLVSEFLKKVHKDSGLGERLDELISKEEYEDIRGKLFGQSQLITTVANKIADYLKAMKVEYEVNKDVNGMNADIYIPNKKTIIKIVLPRDIKYDRVSFSGKTLTSKRIIESFTEFNSIFLNIMEFNGCVDHMSKVNLLISKGIASENTSGTYDFSHIKTEKVEVKSDSSSSSSSSSSSDEEIEQVIEKEEKLTEALSEEKKN